MKQVKYWVETILALPFALIGIVCLLIVDFVLSADNDKFEKVGEFLHLD